MGKPEIVQRADSHVTPTRFEVTPFQRPTPGERLRFEVNLVAEAGERMHKQARVEPNMEAWGPFEIACDEGTALGGDDSAPPPLSYLAAGVAFCLLTHLQQFSRQQGLHIDKLGIEQRMRFVTQPPGNAEDRGDEAADCDQVETHVVVESPEEPDRIRALVDRAWHACMALQTVVTATPQQTHIHLNDRPVSRAASDSPPPST